MNNSIVNGGSSIKSEKKLYIILLKGVLFKAIFLTLLFCASLNHNTYAQAQGNTYSTALGVKFYPTGVTFKTFLRSNAAFEAIGYFWDRGTRITGLYEYHFNLTDSGNLKWYIGPGAHVGIYNAEFFDGGTTIGIDGVLGLDYKFPNIPFNVSLDWQPSYEFGDFSGVVNWGGLGLRYTF